MRMETRLLTVFVTFTILKGMHMEAEACHVQESEALLVFKESWVNASEDFFNSGPWVKGTDCCKWSGIQCDPSLHGHVVSLILCDYLMEFHDPFPAIEGGLITKSLSELTYLRKLHLSHINLGGTIPQWLYKLSHLEVLAMADNNLSGGIPPTLGMLTNLTDLDLSGNQLKGSIPSSLGMLTNLTHLDLSGNQLNGSLPSSLGSLTSLSVLDLCYNELSGDIPHSFGKLLSLTEVVLSRNRMNGTISEDFLDNLASLSVLNVSYSGLAFNVTTTWIPPFLLIHLYMSSSLNRGPIPSWISSQYRIKFLELRDNNLVGEIPSWLWLPDLVYLDISGNHLQGPLAPLDTPYLEHLDVSHNELSHSVPSDIDKRLSNPFQLKLLLNDNFFIGQIPAFLGLKKLQVLDMSNNMLTGTIPLTFGNLSLLEVLILANNSLHGNVPVCLTNLSELAILNLANNHFEGTLPKELGRLVKLKSLLLHNNKLHGLLPLSLTKCTEMLMLSLGGNGFVGKIPSQIGNLSCLRILLMRRNGFGGSIPSEIGRLKYLRVLDLSSNNLSGLVPPTFFTLQAMTVISDDYSVQTLFDVSDYLILWDHVVIRKTVEGDAVELTTKGLDLSYKYIYSAMAYVDLSNNYLSGDVKAIGNLKGLMFLNLSTNNLSGRIPNKIGNLTRLESLDLSSNKFIGEIPQELASLSYLGALNLSYNNLSGRIPQEGQMTTFTFDNSSYLGNPDLWGCPLERNCSRKKVISSLSPPPPPVAGDEWSDSESIWYWIAAGLSYALGFAGVVSLLVFNMRSRTRIFEVYDCIIIFLFRPLVNKR